MAFRGTVRSAFFIHARGTAVVLEEFEGEVRRGMGVVFRCPGGEVSVKVRSVEFALISLSPCVEKVGLLLDGIRPEQLPAGTEVFEAPAEP
jgi:hypothetical protein